MGEVLQTMIKALEERMDTGVLHDLGSTRLHMLIGQELISKSGELPDSLEVIEIIENAMKKYFGMTMEEGAEIDEEPEKMKAPDEGTSKSGSALKFKLNVRKNPDNFHAIVNKIPVIFSPEPLKSSLNKLIKETLENKEPGLYGEIIENTAFENSYNMLTDVLESLPSVDEFKKIRLGLVIYKLLGFGDSKLKRNESQWEVLFNSRKDTDINFCTGYVKGIFKAVMEDKYNQLKIEFSEDPARIVVETSAG